MTKHRTAYIVKDDNFVIRLFKTEDKAAEYVSYCYNLFHDDVPNPPSIEKIKSDGGSFYPINGMDPEHYECSTGFEYTIEEINIE